MAVTTEDLMRLSDSVSQLVDGAFANLRAKVVDPNAIGADEFNQLIDAATEELSRRRVTPEPGPIPRDALRSPQPTMGPIGNFHDIPILDASGSGSLRRPAR